MATLTQKLQILRIQVQGAQGELDIMLQHVYRAQEALGDDTDEAAAQTARATRKMNRPGEDGKAWTDHLRDLRNMLDQTAGDTLPMPRDWEAWEPTAEQLALLGGTGP